MKRFNLGNKFETTETFVLVLNTTTLGISLKYDNSFLNS